MTRYLPTRVRSSTRRRYRSRLRPTTHDGSNPEPWPRGTRVDRACGPGLRERGDERALAEIIRTRFPALYVSCSSEISREFREYERLSTTVLNAYAGPRMQTYLDRLADGIRDLGIPAPPYTVHSNGGLMSIPTVRRFPVRTCLSGPAAGVVGRGLGTLDLIVLRALSTMGPLHAYGLAARLEQVADDPFPLNQGTLYPALVRLEQKGWIRGSWGRTETNREAKFYAITKPGLRALESETGRWRRLSGLVERLLADRG